MIFTFFIDSSVKSNNAEIIISYQGNKCLENLNYQADESQVCMVSFVEPSRV